MRSKMDAIANASRTRETCEALRSGPRIIKHGDQWECVRDGRDKVWLRRIWDLERVLLLIWHFLILHFGDADNLRGSAEFLVIAEGLFQIHVEVLYQG